MPNPSLEVYVYILSLYIPLLSRYPTLSMAMLERLNHRKYSRIEG